MFSPLRGKSESADDRPPATPVRRAGSARPLGAGPARAFSLVEALVAITVLAVGIVGSLAAFSMALRSHARSANYEAAVEVASNELVAAVAAPADQLNAHAGSSGRYSWTVSYSDKPGGLMLATVTLKWSDQGRDAKFEISEVFLPRSQ